MPPASDSRPPRRPTLERSALAADPLAQFRVWFDEAVASDLHEPTAVALATIGTDGSPAARMVLLKGFDADGLRFFTNYESRKARELARDPRAAMLIHWGPLGRQVRIEGTVARLPEAESDAYFDTRPLASRLSAIASPQSAVIDGRDALEASVRRLTDEYRHGHPPRPANWGGYRLAPVMFEFWQAGLHRLHDRFRYRRRDAGWIIERLAFDARHPAVRAPPRPFIRLDAPFVGCLVSRNGARRSNHRMSTPNRPSPRPARGTPLRNLLDVLWQQPLWAIPFAIFFGVIFGATWAGFVAAYRYALVFAYCVRLAIWVVHSFLDPRRLAPLDDSDRSTRIRISVMYMSAAVIGSYAAVFILGLTFAPEFIHSRQAFLASTMYTLLFVGLFGGINFAIVFYRQAVERARAVDQANAALAQAELRALRAIHPASVQTPE
jgi:pyridoxamine 5'-phosphate oxidase